MSILFRRLSFLFVTVFVLAGALTVGWFYLRKEADERLRVFIAQEAEKGRDWTCENRSFDGYPFALVMTCDRPQMVAAGDDLVRLNLARLQAEASVFALGKVTVAMVGPLEARFTLDRLMTAEWRDFKIELARDHAVATVDDVAARLTRFAASPEETIRVQRLLARVAPTADRVPEAQAWDLNLEAGGIDWQGLHALTTNSEPLTVQIAGIVTGLASRSDQPLPQALDAWRSAGGTVRLSNAQLTKGDLRAGLTGELRLDDQRRPTGDIEVWASSLEPLQPLLKTLKIGANITAMTALLRAVGGQTADDPDRIRLPLGLSNGRVRVGPIATPIRLSPLY